MKKEELATIPATMLPDFLVGTAGMGNEGVSSKDVTYPRVGVIQALSPEIDKGNAKYIQGADLGDLFNTLTREIIPQPLMLMDCFFQKSYGVFKLRTSGGGYKAQFATEAEAQKFVENDFEGGQLEIIDTGIHMCLLLDQQATTPTGEAVMFFTKTKLKVSRQMNTILKGKGAARWATIWNVETVKEINSKNQPYYNLKVTDAGFVKDKALFDRGSKLYEDVREKVVAVSAEDISLPASDFEVY
jgi:hypothetical protein